MKFNVSSSELLKGLMDISKAIPVKTSLPILENFLFDLKGGILEVTASDSELTLRTQIEVDNTEEEGSIAVPARHMIDLLKELPDQPIAIRTTSDSADDEIRPAMNGIFFDIDLESTTLVASDSHKLICYTTTDVKATEKSSFILHKKPAAVLRAILGKDENPVQIAFDSSTVVFTCGNTTMVCRLVVGKYPKYRDVIPQNNANVLRINRTLLLNTVRRVAVCANKASNHIKFDLKEGQLEISAQDLGFAIAAYEKIACDYSGDELTIGFKSTFLTEILSNMGCEELVMKFADSRRAALIVPSEEEAASEKICGIIMPIMIA